MKRDYVVNYDAFNKIALICYSGSEKRTLKEIADDFDFHIKRGIQYFLLSDAPSFVINVSNIDLYPKLMELL